MITYLTSHIGGSVKKDGVREPAPLGAENGFLESLRKNWKNGADVLIMSADPEDTGRNDSIRDIFEEAFPMSGLPVGRMVICDKRNEAEADEISGYDVVVLAGGHVPTQNAFFGRLCLKEKLKCFSGIVIGISAGTMNCAETVYAQPELEGESLDKEYRRFLPGLGITRLMILPHYQDIREEMLDGKRLLEDITFPDSCGRRFYGLADGSYVLIENGTAILHGEAYLIRDGRAERICEAEKQLVL